MERAFAFGVVSERSRGELLILAVVLATFVVAAALQLAHILPNHDSVWLLVAAERMLEGGTYERDFFEVNPPLAILIHAPAIPLRELLGQGAYPAYVVVSLIYVAISLALLRKVVADGFPRSSDFHLWLLPIVAVELLIRPGYDFGQREHLFVAFVMPYLAMHALQPSRAVLSRGGTVLVSAWACLGLFLKPGFLLLPVLIAVARAVRQRSLQSLISLDMITICAMGLIYTALVLIRFPDYFLVAQYALEFYAVYQEDLFLVALVPVLYAVVGVGITLIAGRIAESPEEVRMFGLLTLAAWVATASAVMQRKGWSYHVLPVEMFVDVCVLMIVVMLSKRIGRNASSRTFRLAARAAPVIAFVLPLQAFTLDSESMSRGELRETELYSVLAPVAAGKRIYFFSSGVIVGTRWVETIGARWSSRFSCLWLVPGYVTAAERGTLSEDQFEKIPADIRRYVAEDFERYRPEVVLVDRRAYQHGFLRPFDFLDFFLADERFAAIWDSYSYHRMVDGLEIYLLSDSAAAPGAGGSR